MNTSNTCPLGATQAARQKDTQTYMERQGHCLVTVSSAASTVFDALLKKIICPFKVAAITLNTIPI